MTTNKIKLKGGISMLTLLALTGRFILHTSDTMVEAYIDAIQFITYG
jgi:hypothetical protein